MNGEINWITNFVWGIADDVLRDLYVRGKYRDVILPMMVLRRLDAVIEPIKQAVLDMKASLDKAGITNQDQAQRQATMRDTLLLKIIFGELRVKDAKRFVQEAIK